MRAFVGLPLPWEAADLLSRRAGGAGVGRAVSAENLHLTLAFLDDQPQAALEALHEGLSLIAGDPVTLNWGPPEFLGGAQTRVLALMVDPDPALLHLHGRVRSAIRAAGITAPPERFCPHVTLIRLPRRLDPAAEGRLQRFIAAGAGGPAHDLGPVMVNRFGLYRSHLDRDGAWYEELADYPLGPDLPQDFGWEGG